MQVDHPDGGRREPIFNAPAVVVGLLGVLVLVHVWREAAGNDEIDWALAFIPARYGAGADEVPGGRWAWATSFVTHMFVHGNSAHLVINSAWLLAVGTPIARRMPPAAFLALFVLCGIGGAALYLVLNLGQLAPMVGASGAISGLMAGVFRLIYAANDNAGRSLLREHPAAAPGLTLRGVCASRPALTAIAVWVVINFVAAVALTDMATSGGIAWQAHLGGFFAGLVAFGLFDRGPRTDHPR